MDERNKALPLIVSEILIEMHEMKEALNRVASVVLKQQEHTNAMFNTLQDESRKNMEFMTALLKDFRRETLQLTADVRQETASLISEVRREGLEERQFLSYSINKALGQQQQVNTAFEQRLTELEAKYNG